ncbi:hypothetical protein PHLGIDRAFT_126409 [Phlebiopsis gigantea 11061_1 CR5-6]|uniref:UFSP1/2/DUB catalytic domain-containing protein n=1 Tax=Phlebiopsis gigantea (strain 11061_1 CR5-6) TaxID=745531 RepID=A0A0C3SAJ1_PHLG1|nr:hypothetical protein PHLGIDRAFT_126409 [Phlebiopsis gigantea 11061_1 CR5-6]
MTPTGSQASDDIEFLYERRATKLHCQICAVDLVKLTEEQKIKHYDNHFSEQPQASTSSLKPRLNNMPPRSTFSPLKRKRGDSGPEEVFWHSGRSDPPPSNFTPGLIPVLKKALMKAHSKNQIEKAYLCSDVAVHVGTESWDRGWGCGYRNFLMSSSALMGQQSQPLYFPLLDDPLPPGVRNLQRWIEDAWAEGYDDEGAQQLKHSLFGTTKWIGTAGKYLSGTCFNFTTDIQQSYMLPSLLAVSPGRLRSAAERQAVLQQFNVPHLSIYPGTDALLRWIVDYFTQDAPKQGNINDALRAASPVVITDKMPIVLQHAGHSRTVIGYERHQGKITLLMFDPGRRVPSDIRELALASTASEGGSSSYSPRKSHASPKKVLQRILHPQSSGNTLQSKNKAKRLRAGDEVIILDSDSDCDDSGSSRKPASPPPEIKPSKILNVFRVSPSNIARKDKYQILYFPMTAPLTDEERHQRKVVTSKKVS